jgi:hypothetical protein
VENSVTNHIVLSIKLHIQSNRTRAKTTTGTGRNSHDEHDDYNPSAQTVEPLTTSKETTVPKHGNAKNKDSQSD